MKTSILSSCYCFASLSFQLLYRECIPTEAFFVQPPALHPISRRTASFSSAPRYQSQTTADTVADPPLASLLKNTTLATDFTLAKTPEDCIELQVGQRLVCVGDVHGDFQALEDFLTIAGVYDSTTKSWCGEDTILVQCGDILDRGSEELKCYELLSKLSQEAPKKNGKVIVLLGNHEILNAMGLFQYATTDKEYEQVVGPIVDEELQSMTWRVQYVGNQPARWAMFEPGGPFSNTLFANMKVAVKVGRTVCVHAGLTAKHLEDYGGIEKMNQDANAWLSNGKLANVTFNNKGNYTSDYQRFVEAEARQTSYINSAPEFLNGGIGASSPIWMRDYSFPNDKQPNNPKAQMMIDDALDKVDCDRMVMGHTVQRRINAVLGGKAWRVDVGASQGVLGGTPEVLEIVKARDGTEEVSVLTKTGKIRAMDREVLYFTL